MKALMADDDVFVRKCLTQLVPWQDLDFSQVLEAENGTVALKIALEEKPDLIISDVKMPILNGLELAQKLRDSMVDICIIILSEYSNFEFVQNALKLGVQDYILKPITRERLTEITDKIRQTMTALEKRRYFTSLRANRAGIQTLVHGMLESADAAACTEAFEYMALHQIHIEDLKPFGMTFLHELFEMTGSVTFQKADVENMRSAALKAYAELKNVADVIRFVKEQCEGCAALCAKRVPQTVNYVALIADYIEKNYAAQPLRGVRFGMAASFPGLYRRAVQAAPGEEHHHQHSRSPYAARAKAARRRRRKRGNRQQARWVHDAGLLLQAVQRLVWRIPIAVPLHGA